MRLLHLFIVSTLLTACNAVLGLDERPSKDVATGASGPSSSTSMTGAGGTSGCQGQDCFQDPPAGFSGPVLFSRGDTTEDVAACGDSYGNEIFVTQGALADGLHHCPCECDDAVGITCTVSVISWGVDNCTGQLAVDTFSTGGQCEEIHNDTRSVSYPEPAADTTAASCAATAGIADIPEVQWDLHGRACGPVEDLEGTPSGFDACVYQAGEVPCSGDWYTERTLWYAGVDDQRGCMDDCACGQVEAQCNPVLVANGGHSCNESPDYPIPAPLGCVAGYFDSAELVSMTPTGTCAPVSATATGELSPSGPTTVCCHR